MKKTMRTRLTGFLLAGVLAAGMPMGVQATTEMEISDAATEQTAEGLPEDVTVTINEDTEYWSSAYSNYWNRPTIHRYSKARDGEIYLSKNFQVKQFACKDGSDEIFIDSELVTILQKIHDHFGKEVEINSAYRNPTHNKNVGGASRSFHLYGMAADIAIKGVTPERVAAYAESIGVQGIGLYGTFTHVDARDYHSYWNVIDGVTYTRQTFVALSELQITDKSKDGFTVKGTVQRQRPVEWLRIAVWTDENGQDDLKWYSVGIGNNAFSLRVNTSEFANRQGIYYIHAYAYMGTVANTAFSGTQTYVDRTKPVITNVKISNLSSKGYTVSCTVSDNRSIKKISFPTWTHANGQDDLIWHSGVVKNGVASIYVSTSDHNNESGTYTTHIYAYDEDGNYSVAGKTLEVPEKKKLENGRGDVDGNGLIDAADAMLVLRYTVGAAELSEDAVLAADANEDGTVDAKDALYILSYMVGL